MTGIVETLAVVGSAAASAAPYVTAGLSLAGAGLQIMSAQQQAKIYKGQAAYADFQAQQELLRGREQAVQIQRQLQAVQAAQHARYAAAGVLLDDGTPATVQAATEAEAERQLTISRNNAVIAAEERRKQAGMLRDAASSTLANSWLNVGTSMFDLVDRNLQRLPGTVTRPGLSAGARGAPLGSTAGAFAADARLGALY